MKNAFLIIFLLFLLGSCLKEPDFHSYQVNLVVDFGTDFPQEHMGGARVTLFNQLKSYTLEESTNTDGSIQFSSLEPGFYSVTISHSYRSGIITYHYNGLKDIEVFGNATDTIKVYGNSSSALVIKEIYYCGSTTPAGKTYSADQYIEIFNNSPEIQYADGISVLEHESYAIEENIWKSIKDTIVVKMIWTIPGSGNEVPVEPGKSLVLACNGVNHRDDPNLNPLSPVNLGNADFEFYVSKNPVKDVDSPLVPNLTEDLNVNRGNDVTFYTRGGSGLSIAKIPVQTNEERISYIKKHLIPSLSSGSSTKYYAKIADKYVLDAVEVVMDEAHAIYKRFPPDLDAGYTYVASGVRSGKCIRRKIKEIINGRLVYQDTNNSTEDFLKDVDPKPKIYE